MIAQNRFSLTNMEKTSSQKKIQEKNKQERWRWKRKRFKNYRFHISGLKVFWTSPVSKGGGGMKGPGQFNSCE